MAFIVVNVKLPSSFSAKSTGLLILFIIACAGLIGIAARGNCHNVKKWEMILYYLLNIVFVILIMYCAFELNDMAADVAVDKIPYEKGTEEYNYAYDDIDYDGLSSSFAFVIFGMLGIVLATIFAIVGIIKTCASKVEIVEQNQVVLSGENVLEQSNVKITNNSHDNMKANYCSNCGQKLRMLNFVSIVEKKLNNG